MHATTPIGRGRLPLFGSDRSYSDLAAQIFVLDALHQPDLWCRIARYRAGETPWLVDILPAGIRWERRSDPNGTDFAYNIEPQERCDAPIDFSVISGEPPMHKAALY